MNSVKSSVTRATVEPLPANITSVQPGGGFCYQVELAWGRWRRWWLQTFRKTYVRRMADCRRGDNRGAPHAILDPRDLKFCRNLCTAHWEAADDRFAWRDLIPFARWGLCELFLMSGTLLAVTVALAFWHWWAAMPTAVVLVLIVWFFRDPPRRIPADANLLLSPADGKVVELTPLDDHPFVGGPALRIGIFLSIFNVHVNRSPLTAKVVKLNYSPGKFLNAMDPESAILNENMWIGLEQEAAPHRKLVVRQIAGLIARRIVCPLRPGDVLKAGEHCGMIKLGSRTELIVPATGLRLEVKIGQMVHAGCDILARYPTEESLG